MREVSMGEKRASERERLRGSNLRGREVKGE